MPTEKAPKPKRNYYISYIKGFAIITLLTLHLLDWSNMVLTPHEKMWREFLFPSVLFFMSTLGSVVYIAYGHHEHLLAPTKRLLRRGFELIAIYFLYNLLKLRFYDFQQEPFYYKFISQQKFGFMDILSLHAFSVPISIILTIGIFLLISPFFLWITKKTRYPRSILGGIFLVILIFNYTSVFSQSAIKDFLLAKNNITFSLLQWSIPYMMGFYLAMTGLEKQKGKAFFFFLILTLCAGGYQFLNDQSLYISEYMYPLKPYYVVASFCFLYILIFLFSFLEKINHAVVRYFLAVVRILGDYTLTLYIFHWIVVDLTLWIFAPETKLIWWSVSTFLILFLAWHHKKIREFSGQRPAPG